MAIINVELRMMIAERLANDNYRQEILDVRESLRLHLLTYLKTNKIPKMVMDVFEKYPDFFRTVDCIYIQSYNFKEYLPAEWGSRTFHEEVNLQENIPFEGENTVNLIKSIPKDNYIHELIRKYYKLEMDRYFMEKRLKCIMQTKRFTEKTLKQEFPEAYQVYLDITTSDIYDNAKVPNGATTTLCDNIENIRAQLKTNRNVEEKVQAKSAE